MRIKTNDLTGAALDWAVAKCEGLNPNTDSAARRQCVGAPIQTSWSQVRQAKNGAFGWVVSILGEDYTQKGTKAEAYEAADKINERCAGMTIGAVREYYKLGNYPK